MDCENENFVFVNGECIKTSHKYLNLTFVKNLYHIIFGYAPKDFKVEYTLGENTKKRELKDGEKIPVEKRPCFWLTDNTESFVFYINGKVRQIIYDKNAEVYLKIGYKKIVEFAGKDANKIWTVIYKVPKTTTQGTLVPGEFVKIQDGMVFSVTDTSKA